MGAPAKLITVLGLLAKAESSYAGGGATSAATDGVQLEELAKLDPNYANSGARSAPPGILGYQKKVAPSGKTGDLPMKVAARPFGAAYSASNKPNIHALIQGCGFDATGSFVGGSEKWTYTPSANVANYTSLVMALYERGELWPLTGVLGDFTWSFKGPEVPIFDFAFKGLLGTYSDVSLPAITYPSVDPPKAVGVQLSLFGVTNHVVKEATIKLGRTLVPRLDVNANGGHAGFAPGRITPTLEVLVETPLIATYDFFAAWENATAASWVLNTAGSQYNRYHWAGPSAQIMSEPKLEDDSAVALTRLTLQLNPSSLIASDGLSLIFD